MGELFWHAAYLAVGVVVGGLWYAFGDDDEPELMYVLFWPVFVAFGVIYAATMWSGRLVAWAAGRPRV